MRTIYKYTLSMLGTNHVLMPRYATILTVQNQNDKICVWAEVNPKQPAVARTFEVYGTGREIHEGEYIGTVQTGPYVWHVYEKI